MWRLLRPTSKQPTLFVHSRALAKKAGEASPDSSKAANFNPDVVTGLNVFKDGKEILPGVLADGKDPEVLADSEYPDWVFTLHEPHPTIAQLTAKYEQDPESFSERDYRRLIRQWNRKRIKQWQEEHGG